MQTWPLTRAWLADARDCAAGVRGLTKLSVRASPAKRVSTAPFRLTGAVRCTTRRAAGSGGLGAGASTRTSRELSSTLNRMARRHRNQSTASACRRKPHAAGLNLVQQVLVAASPLALGRKAPVVPVDHECPAESPRMLHNAAASLHRFLPVEAHAVAIEQRGIHDRQRQFQEVFSAGQAKHLRCSRAIADGVVVSPGRVVAEIRRLRVAAASRSEKYNQCILTPGFCLSGDGCQLLQLRPAGVRIAPRIDPVNRKLCSRLRSCASMSFRMLANAVGRGAKRARGSIGTHTGLPLEGNEKERGASALAPRARSPQTAARSHAPDPATRAAATGRRASCERPRRAAGGRGRDRQACPNVPRADKSGQCPIGCVPANAKEIDVVCETADEREPVWTRQESRRMRRQIPGGIAGSARCAARGSAFLHATWVALASAGETPPRTSRIRSDGRSSLPTSCR